MRSNSNRVVPAESHGASPLSTDACRTFVGAYSELRHQFLLNAQISCIAIAVERPDELIIRQIESEEEVCSVASCRSFERFTDQQNETSSEEEDLVPRRKIQRETCEVMDSLRETAHFSNEGESENKAHYHNKEPSVKQRLMSKLVSQKSKLLRNAEFGNEAAAFNKTLPTMTQKPNPHHRPNEPADQPKPTSRQPARTTRVIFSPSAKNHCLKQRTSNLR